MESLEEAHRLHDLPPPLVFALRCQDMHPVLLGSFYLLRATSFHLWCLNVQETLLFSWKFLLYMTFFIGTLSLVSFENMYFNLWNFYQQTRNSGPHSNFRSACLILEIRCSPVLIVLKSPSGTLSGLSLCAHPQESWNVSWFHLVILRNLLDLTSSLFYEKRNSFANAEFLIIYGKY